MHTVTHVKFSLGASEVGGLDGNSATVQLSEGRCIVGDLSSRLDLGNRWDWLLCLEVRWRRTSVDTRSPV